MTTNIKTNTTTPNKVLKELGIILPEAASPVANYQASLVVDDMLYISGQLPMKNGKVHYRGQAGTEVFVDDAIKAASLCAINIIAQIRGVCGENFETFDRLIKVGVFVNSAPVFTEHATVANGASDLLATVFGERGKHVRAAVGCSSLPLLATVEVEAVVKLTS